MNYVKVESSQIEAIGFGDGFYGPETLGIKFPPTKKQAAAGQPGSEYHYGNVSPRTHQALMAAPSIGSYFGQNIKAHPEQYPFTKMEAETLPGIKSAIAKEYTTTTDCILKGLSCKDKASAGMAVLTMVASRVCMKKPQATSHSKTLSDFSSSGETESIFIRMDLKAHSSLYKLSC